MALVTITGNLWDHGRKVIPANQQPELWFRPERSRVGPGLMAGVSTKATLSLTTGNFSVELESDGDELTYIPWARWIVDPTSDDPEDRAWGYAEFPRIWADTGGPIGDLIRPSTGWVYCSPLVPVTSGRIRAEFQYNTTTTSLYRRAVG